MRCAARSSSKKQEAYDTWLASQPTYAEQASRTAGDAAAGAGQYAVCAACHGQQGEGNVALNAPKIAGQSEWYLRRQLENYKNGLRGAHPDDTYGRQMAPMAATLATDAAMDNVIARIRSFPDEPPPATIEGDVEKGKRLYNVCAYCHGANGQGIQAMNAPRMSSMTDWYLKRQLQNFKDDIRGSHTGDYYGFQMGFMARTLQDEQAMNDLVAYINTL